MHVFHPGGRARTGTAGGRRAVGMPRADGASYGVRRSGIRPGIERRDGTVVDPSWTRRAQRQRGTPRASDAQGMRRQSGPTTGVPHRTSRARREHGPVT
ncbi:hypothetical protein ACH4TE_20495 [Streptomyces sioyaensis]|uniref:hypothetical protein n=1 Tax=Streptomyces sioyaensis TaxID=67364 RepID=UPI0037A4D7DC